MRPASLTFSKVLRKDKKKKFRIILSGTVSDQAVTTGQQVKTFL
jgi:hypothetical protein